MQKMDIAPFALPRCPPGELWFEEPRDIESLVMDLRKAGTARIRVSYRRNKWPEALWTQGDPDLRDPARFGWQPTDDWWNGSWQKAAVLLRREGTRVTVAFKPLRSEGFRDLPPERNVAFRRTLAVRVEMDDPASLRRLRAYTTSLAGRSVLRVTLDAGKRTRGDLVRLSGHNCRVWRRGGNPARCFVVDVAHMLPSHRHAGDAGLLTIATRDEEVTVAVADAMAGGVWYADAGIYVAAEDGPDFAAYRAAAAGSVTVAKRVASHPEQSFAGAFHGLPRPHAVHTHVGVKHARQRFLVEPNGDIVLPRTCVSTLGGASHVGARFRNPGDARFFFGMEGAIVLSRSADASPAPLADFAFRRGDVRIDEQCFAVPLLRPLTSPPASSDEPVAALVRFTFHNEGDRPVRATLHLAYSGRSGRSQNALLSRGGQDDHLVPTSPADTLSVEGDTVWSEHEGARALRCSVNAGSMDRVLSGGRLTFSRELDPGASCAMELRIPFLSLDSAEEIAALRALDHDRCRDELRRFWRAQCSAGAELRTPVPHLDRLHRNHLAHVLVSDFPMPDDSSVINTSVGTSTYGNFSNESCMIVQELAQRGMHEEARRRLELWVKYQGTAPQPGNFTDYDGMYYGAGGFEQGNYNQHHGWVLWCIAEYYFLTRDDRWLGSVADSVVRGCDWIGRQRRLTTAELPHSRGWEHGFLPAGSLEDVVEYCYWLSTNALTWRGADHAARALEAIGHPEGARLRREADAYAIDLRRGLDAARRASPLVRLRDGRWVPTYPSRLYRRGREYGWIREVLEGSVYLLISGLYDPRSREAGWILDDFHDNRYVAPPYGYALRDVDGLYFQRGGFSIQPCLLAGLVPHLDRDEPEVAIWMFFNSLLAVYREEIEGLSEHPLPELGFSNSAQWKTSDEANTLMWLRSLIVWWDRGLLHVGRAIPRAWLSDGEEVALSSISTYHGVVDVRYRSAASSGSIECSLQVRAHQGATPPPRLLVRFRHPSGSLIRRVSVDGEDWGGFDPLTSDVDITGHSGDIRIRAEFGDPREAGRQKEST